METIANTVPIVSIKVSKSKYTLASIIKASKIIAAEFNMNLHLVPEVRVITINFTPTSLDGDKEIEALNTHLEEVFGNTIVKKKEA